VQVYCVVMAGDGRSWPDPARIEPFRLVIACLMNIMLRSHTCRSQSGGSRDDE
jgi:hypothetical protein